jgi:hypothetical protein
MTLEPSPVSKRVAFFGDSTCRTFDTCLLRHGADVILAHARSFPFLRSRDLFADERLTRLSARVSRDLWDLGTLASEAAAPQHRAVGSYAYRGRDDEPMAIDLYASMERAPLVISCGRADAIELAYEFAGRYCFELEAKTDADLTGVEPYHAPTQLGYHVVVDRIQRILGPLCELIRTVTAAATRETYVLGLTAPALRKLHSEPPPRLLVAIFQTFNHVLRAMCEQHGAHYLDAWAIASPRGRRAERFFRGEFNFSAAFLPHVVARVLRIDAPTERSLPT